MDNVDPNWWKRLFDEIYLITDARSVCDEELTLREVDFLEQALKLEISWPILDLCGGQGRHSMELSRRGFKDVTVLDYSEFLITLGRAQAEKEGLNTIFVRNDARNTGLPDQKYKVVFVMASSFGYCNDEKDNNEILRESFRLLMPGGSLLMDLPNRDFVLENFTPHSWHEADEEIVVCRHRELKNETIYSREVVLSKKKGLIRDERYCTRLYSGEEITEMLLSSGFSSVSTRKDFVSHEECGDYGCMTNRMIVIAEKR